MMVRSIAIALCAPLVAAWTHPSAPLPRWRSTLAASTAEPDAPRATASRTERLLSTLPDAADQASGAGFAGSLAGLRGLDAGWAKLRRRGFGAPAEFVKTRAGERVATETVATPEFDVVVLGGTLGIFLASALAARGLKARGEGVCVGGGVTAQTMRRL